MEIELTPELPDEIEEAVAEAVERALQDGADPGPWWRAGVHENVEPDLPGP